MNEDRDLLIALGEALLLLLDHTLHSPGFERHNRIRLQLNNQVQAAKGMDAAADYTGMSNDH